MNNKKYNEWLSILKSCISPIISGIFLLISKLIDNPNIQVNDIVYIVALAILIIITLVSIFISINNNSEIVDRINNIQPKVESILRKHLKKSRNVSITIIGLGFQTGWPSFQESLEKEKKWIKDLSIKIYILDPDYIANNNDIFIDPLLKSATESIVQMQKFIKDHPNIDMEINTYKDFPAMHGYKINDDYIISYSQWNVPEYISISKPNGFYEIFDSKNNSKRAAYYRDYFENILSHYRKKHACITKTKNDS